MKFSEIKEKLENSIISIEDFAFECNSGIIDELPELGDCEEIDQYGGESQGDNWWSVKYFKDHNVYIKVTGFYSSYNGTDFDGGWECLSEVKPKEKTITVYE